ncbi:MAG: hypothetical protein HY698_12930 [Deltaproteobacteria bacterium]|nr:hypothetical protein [Deltaproteobacteria bacterium]
MGGLTWKIRKIGDGVTHVALSGVITEAARLDQISNLAGNVIVDFAEVTQINSLGVRVLLGWLDALEGRAKLEAERCSPVIVMQLNMLPGLARRFSVRSFLAPMECETCSEDRETLVELEPGSRDVQIPVTRCNTCGEPMTLAEPEDRYLAFLTDE